jgi:hypothetical protein
MYATNERKNPEKKVLQSPPKEPETTTAPLPTPPRPKSNALDSAGGLWAEAKVCVCCVVFARCVFGVCL